MNCLLIVSQQAKILENTASTSPTLYQFIGDTQAFSPNGTRAARNFLQQFLTGSHLIQYGLTGRYLQRNGNVNLDTNALVSEYIEANPSQAKRVIATVVGDSVTALEQGGCTASNRVSQFVMIYNEHGNTKRGDDTPIDGMMNAGDGDRLILIEGEIDAFTRVVNALENNIPISAFWGVRDRSNAPSFSATEFLSLLLTQIEDKNNPPSPATLERLRGDYLDALPTWNPAHPNIDAFDVAMTAFIGTDETSGLYTRLPSLMEILKEKFPEEAIH